MTKILVVTSHPVAPPWDSADKQVAVSISRHLSARYRFSLIGRAMRPAPGRGIRTLPILSMTGVPTRMALVQTAAWATVAGPRMDLIHVVVSLGSGETGIDRALRALRRWARAPVILSAPGVSDDARFPSGLSADAVVVSGAASHAVLSASGVDALEIPMGIPLDRWPLLEPARGIEPTLLFAGHYDEGAGADEAVAIAARLQEHGVGCRLLLAMRPRSREHDRARSQVLRQEAAAAGVPLEIVGTVPDSRALLERADVVLFPGRRLAGKTDVPLIVLEALASGRPVVASDLPQLAPIAPVIRRVAPGDILRAAEEIEYLLGSRRERDAVVAAGRSFVEREASDQRMAAEYARLYDDILAMRS